MEREPKVTPFRAIDYIKTQEDLDVFIRDVAGWSFRAGQEDMKRRAVEALPPQRSLPGDDAWYDGFDWAIEKAQEAIASLEVRDEHR